ncbi:MAG: hypothetical protein LKF37_06285 [Lentilactobacillus diolivorans]|jgi:uncharacterized Tic20 family protein|nr:hypothetical protein [Lentilactobacillus diolivorans]RRG00550.1 MAG: hypothetical protein DUD34_15120 [Lactobacillus sp.]
MSEKKNINALSYFSIVFAPFIFPFIVWLLTANNKDVHETAKHAFLLHLIPVILSILTLMLVGIMGLATKQTQATAIMFVILIVLVALVDLSMFVYNLYLGIKILLSDENDADQIS